MNTGKKYYHPELDCLRFFAFLAVFACHVVPSDPDNFKKLGHLASRVIVNVSQAGSLGVTLFFCLSSFLITALLLREFDLKGHLNVRAFWFRRILRIWPLYFFFILFSAVVVPWFLPNNRLEGGFFTMFVLFAANWACMFNGYPLSVSAPLWSVSVEEQFYMAWPLLLSVISPKKLGHMIAGCLVLATTARFTILASGLHHPAIWCNTFAQLDPIAVGALFAIYTHEHDWKPSAALRAGLLTGALVIPLIFIFLFGAECFSGIWSLLFYPVTAVCAVSLLAAIYRSEPILESTSKIRAGLIFLGRMSFGLYVFHVLAIDLAIPVVSMIPAHSLGMKIYVFLLQPVLSFALTLGMAYLSYKFLEMPFLRLKDQFTYVQSAPTELSFKHPVLTLATQSAGK